MKGKTKEFKRPERAICGLLCADIRTSVNHALYCDKCNELREMTKNDFYIVKVKL